MPAASTSSSGTVLPCWTVYDAVVGYTADVFGRPMELQLNVENLTELHSAGGRSWSPPRGCDVVGSMQ